MAMSWAIRQGDTLPPLRAALKQHGVSLNLENCTVTLRVWPRAGSQVVEHACTLVNAAAGVVQWSPVAGDTDVAGQYRGSFVVTYPDLTTLTVPTNGALTIVVVERTS